jgi:hypothetical protein
VAEINVIKAEQVLEIPNYGFCCQSDGATVQMVDEKKISDVVTMMKKENVKPCLFTLRRFKTDF